MFVGLRNRNNSYASFQDIFEFRLMLETEGAKNAALRMRSNEVRHLDEILQSSKTTTDFEALQKFDLQFHSKIMKYSHNPLLISVFSNVCSAFEKIVLQNYARLSQAFPTMLIGAVEQRSKILEALQSHDAQAAREEMICHLNTVYNQS